MIKSMLSEEMFSQ